MKIILFGIGKVGHQALRLLGKPNIAYFVDNHRCAVKTIDGVSILDFEDYKRQARSYITILSMGSKASEEVAEQLQRAGIIRFLFWEEVIDALHSSNENVSNKMLRREIKCDMEVWQQDLRYVCEILLKEHHLSRDKASQVEFYFIDAFEYSHFLPLYKALLEQGIRARMVIEPCWLNVVGEWFDFHRACSLLEADGIDYATLLNPKAKVAFTTQFPKYLAPYHGKKCLLFYGVNFFKEKVFSLREEVAHGFDCIFTHGEFDVKKLLELLPPERIVDMSYPRYFPYFQQKPDSDKIKEELSIDTEKPILLYCPTWDQFSSISRYAAVWEELRQRFYVVAKSHHCTYRLGDKKPDLDMLYQICDTVLPGTFELEKAVSLADFAICDATSGVFAELMFLRPEMKLIALAPPESEDKFFFDISELAVTVHSPQELSREVAKVWKKDCCREARVRKMPKYFSPDIAAGIERSVEKVCSLLGK